LQATVNLGLVETGTEELRKQRVQEALEMEKQTVQKEENRDQIQEIQKSILDDLRNGKFFRTAHHKGGTHLFFDGKDFVRRDYGVEESTKRFATEAEILDCIREFYDWESCKETYPHRPPD